MAQRNTYREDEELEEQINFRDILRVGKYLKPYMAQVARILVVVISMSCIVVAVPYLTKIMIDEAIPNKDLGKLGILAVILAALIVLYEFGLRYRTVAITRVGQLVAQEASRRLGIPFGIIDLSLAPTPAVGDSVGEVLEKIGLEQVGAPGTTAALAMLNDQVKKGGIMASSYVGGLSGAFIPVSEDKNMIDAASSGCLTIEKLEAMTCVCSVGLDMIAIPGDTSAATISGMIADEAAIGMVNQKTTAVRVIPVAGKGVGEMANFGGLMGYAPIMPVNQTSCEAFVTRGGRIPAPIHSFKN